MRVLEITIAGDTYQSIAGQPIREGDYFITLGYPPVMTVLPSGPGDKAPEGYYRKIAEPAHELVFTEPVQFNALLLRILGSGEDAIVINTTIDGYKVELVGDEMIITLRISERQYGR